MVHLCSRISDNLDIFWQELVAVLSESVSVGKVYISHEFDLRGQTELGTVIASISNSPRQSETKATHRLLFGKITRGSENDNHSVVLQLDVPGGAEID
jgi:predicted neutral ceramidase superfamily lipid hydrolase